MRLWIIIVLLLLSASAAAQETTSAPAAPTIEPTMLELVAEDGLKLSGAYYRAHEGDAPAVLLVHQLYATRKSWDTVIQPLLDAGFRVLAVDVRGYGSTRGRINWAAAQSDVRLWLEWLAAQGGTTGVYAIGSSMGSSLALVACDAVDACRGAVALSPGLNYYGVSIADAAAQDFRKLIVYADRDRYPVLAAPEIQKLENPSNEFLVFPGRSHGMDLFRNHQELLALMIEWLTQ